MKKNCLLVLFCLLLSLSYGQRNKFFQLNPQFGINSSRLSTDPDFAEPSARVGYQFGADLRIGGKMFLEPGVYWYRVGSDLLTTDQVTSQPLQDQVKINYLKVPLCVGYSVLDTRLLKFRGSTGLVPSFYSGIKDNIINLNNEDFNKLVLGLRFGIGVDILLFTFDLDYELGLGNAMSTNAGARNDVLSLAVGFKI